MEYFNEERKNTIIVASIIFIVILVISAFLIKISLNKNKTEFIQYSDIKNLEYKVLLKENTYYENNYIEKGNQYIADLINSISTNFKYDFNLENEYNYNYKVSAIVDVTDEKTNKSIYTFSENLTEEKTGQCSGNLKIDENVDVNFNKYNDLIKEFVTTYDLKNAVCKLSLNLDLGIKGTNEDFSKGSASVMSLDIPLAQNTISIDTNYDLTETDNLIEIHNTGNGGKVFLVLGIILIIVDAALLVAFIIYMKKTETDEDKYNGELRKIINNYDSYISRVEDDFNMNGYQILKVQRFTDLLEIRDTMQLPIIMLENKEQSLTCFVIPTPNNILYFFSISVRQYALAEGKHSAEMREGDEERQ